MTTRRNFLKTGGLSLQALWLASTHLPVWLKKPTTN